MPKKISSKFIIAFFTFSALCSIAPMSLFGYGPTGHRTIALIAERQFTNKTKKKLKPILQGSTPVVLSTLLDEIKSETSAYYRQFYSWHYANMPPDKRYEDVEHPKDIKHGIETAMKMLKSDTASADTKRFYLAMLIHLIGDLHQPLHLGRKEDKGANDITVYWFYKKTNLHSVWDSKMIDGYQMSYTELADNMPPMSPHEMKIILQGSIVDWINEVHALTAEVYKSAKPDEKLAYRYQYDWLPKLKRLLQTSGIRLGYLINSIFDE